MRRIRSSRYGAALPRAWGLTGILYLLSGVGCGGGREAEWITASGHVEATEVRISTKVSGILLSFAPREGEDIEIGAVLARIDTVDLALARDVARADRDQAEAELRLRLAGSRGDEIREAEALVERARAELEGAERDLGRMQALLDGGSGTEKGRDDAKTRRDLAKAQHDAARQQLARRRSGARPEEIDAARARHGAAEARIAQIEQQIKDTRVTSPLSGVLTQKLAEEGELVSAGAPLCVVLDLAHPWLTVYVAEPDLSRIRLGQEADVVTDAGEVRRGRVSSISDRAEFTPRNVQTRQERVKLVYKVKIELENGDGIFKAGMPAEARLRSTEG